jgi:hypothetical protein
MHPGAAAQTMIGAIATAAGILTPGMFERRKNHRTTGRLRRRPNSYRDVIEAYRVPVFTKYVGVQHISRRRAERCRLRSPNTFADGASFITTITH